MRRKPFLYHKTHAIVSLADPGEGGAHPARPPNGRGPMMFYATNAKFPQFVSLASLAIYFKTL